MYYSIALADAACSRTHTISTAGGKVGYDHRGKDAGTVTVTGRDGQTAALNLMSQSVSQQNAHGLTLESADALDKIVGWKTESTMISDSGKSGVMQILADKQ
jgi:hypothetical protein